MKNKFFLINLCIIFTQIVQSRQTYTQFYPFISTLNSVSRTHSSSIIYVRLYEAQLWLLFKSNKIVFPLSCSLSIFVIIITNFYINNVCFLVYSFYIIKYISTSVIIRLTLNIFLFLYFFFYFIKLFLLALPFFYYYCFSVVFLMDFFMTIFIQYLLTVFLYFCTIY